MSSVAPSYTVPAVGTITSWTMFGSQADSFTMKIYRHVTGSTYKVVGHSGPQTLTADGLPGNTFPASIAVQPGDFLGFHTITGGSKCAYISGNAGDAFAGAGGDLADGQSAVFPTTAAQDRLNIQATLEPENNFTYAGALRNKKTGTATLKFNLPNPGGLSGSGVGAKVSSSGALTSKAVPAGTATLLVKAKGKTRRKLNTTGAAKVRISVIYTPTSGSPKAQNLKVKLKKKL